MSVNTYMEEIAHTHSHSYLMKLISSQVHVKIIFWIFVTKTPHFSVIIIN